MTACLNPSQGKRRTNVVHEEPNDLYGVIIIFWWFIHV